MRTLIAALLVAVPVAASAAAPSTLTGQYGGGQVMLVATADGARVELGCAVVRVAGPIRIGRDGGFATDGSIDTYQPGPQRADEPAAVSRVHLHGRSSGQTLMLTIETGGEPANTVQLVRNVQVKMIRCL